MFYQSTVNTNNKLLLLLLLVECLPFNMKVSYSLITLTFWYLMVSDVFTVNGDFLNYFYVIQKLL